MCSQISSLESGGAGGMFPPAGGWKPTENGWMKAEGTLSCGWGSTYSQIAPGSNGDLSLFGRVTAPADLDYLCCLEAATYEGTPYSQGGAAIRFGVDEHGVCLIDREWMMKGNLDTSGGRPAYALQPCGPEGTHLYWRNAAGSADASNLKSGGQCVAQGGFKRVVNNSPGMATTPLGRIPYLGHEFPNHECNGDICNIQIRYNTINSAEECCEACRSLLWVSELGGDADADGNPCLAWQIHDGKCNILRKQYFDDRFGSANLGLNASGDAAMTVAEVVSACTEGSGACLRADDSHGNWGSCEGFGATAIEDDCSYFSFLYYRDDASNDTGAASAAPYRKIQEIEIDVDFFDSESVGNGGSSSGSLLSDQFNQDLVATSSYGMYGMYGVYGHPIVPVQEFPFKMACTSQALASRHRLSDLVAGSLGTASGPIEAGAAGFGNCARMQVYSEAVIDDVVSVAGTTVFNEETTIQPLCETPCLPSADLTLECTAEQLRKGLEQTADRRRRLGSVSTSTKPKYILSFTTEGNAKDTFDFKNVQRIYPALPNLPPPEVIDPPPSTIDTPVDNTPSGPNVSVGITVSGVDFSVFSVDEQADFMEAITQTYMSNNPDIQNGVTNLAPAEGQQGRQRRALMQSDVTSESFVTILYFLTDAAASAGGAQIADMDLSAFVAALYVAMPALSTLAPGMGVLLDSVAVQSADGQTTPAVPPVVPFSPSNNNRGFFGFLRRGGGDDNVPLIAGLCAGGGVLIIGVGIGAFVFGKSKVGPKTAV